VFSPQGWRKLSFYLPKMSVLDNIRIPLDSCSISHPTFIVELYSGVQFMRVPLAGGVPIHHVSFSSLLLLVYLKDLAFGSDFSVSLFLWLVRVFQVHVVFSALLVFFFPLCFFFFSLFPQQPSFFKIVDLFGWFVIQNSSRMWITVS